MGIVRQDSMEAADALTGMITIRLHEQTLKNLLIHRYLVLLDFQCVDSMMQRYVKSMLPSIAAASCRLNRQT